MGDRPGRPWGAVSFLSLTTRMCANQRTKDKQRLRARFARHESSTEQFVHCLGKEGGGGVVLSSNGAWEKTADRLAELSAPQSNRRPFSTASLDHALAILQVAGGAGPCKPWRDNTIFHETHSEKHVVFQMRVWGCVPRAALEHHSVHFITHQSFAFY